MTIAQRKARPFVKPVGAPNKFPTLGPSVPGLAQKLVLLNGGDTQEGDRETETERHKDKYVREVKDED